jgi:hypothetical protein
MCMTPTKKTGRNRDNRDGRNPIGAPPASHGDVREDVCGIAVGIGT